MDRAAWAQLKNHGIPYQCVPFNTRHIIPYRYRIKTQYKVCAKSWHVEPTCMRDVQTPCGIGKRVGTEMVNLA